MSREFNFLKKKYYGMLIPNIFIQLSDKVDTVLDVIVVGFLLGSSQLPVLNVVSPFVLFSSIIYSMYGQGASLLAIKAKSNLESEKANRYFTLSIIGCIATCIAYMIFIFIFVDPMLAILNIPAGILEAVKLIFSSWRISSHWIHI